MTNQPPKLTKNNKSGTIYARVLPLVLFFPLASALGAAAQEQSFVYNDHGKRDPFWPLVTAEGSVLSYDTDFLISELHLEGVVIGAGGKNAAIINGKIVQVNDNLGEFVVTEISSGSVVLIKDGERFELMLKKEE